MPDFMTVRTAAIDNFTVICHHLRPDISDPRVSIFISIDQTGWYKCIPFSPGIPGLYDSYAECGIDSTGESMDDAIYELLVASADLVESLAAEYECIDKEDNIKHFLRATMERATGPEKHCPNIDHVASTNQSQKCVQTDNNTQGQLTPAEMGMDIKTATNMGEENEIEAGVEAHKENENGKDYQMDAECSMESGSETETENNQGNPIEGDMLLEFVEKVMEVIDMYKDVKTMLGAKRKKRKGTKQMKNRRMEESIKEKNKPKMKGKKREGNYQFKAPATSHLNPTVEDRTVFEPSSKSISPKTQPQVYTTHNRSVQYNNRVDSTPMKDKGFWPNDNVSDSAICTPAESCLGSDEVSSVPTTNPGPSNTNPQEFQKAIQLALVGMMKDFASGLSK